MHMTWNTRATPEVKKMRTRFRCIEWTGDRGCLIDRTKFQFEITDQDLTKECGGHLQPGEYVTGVVDGERVHSIIIESGPRSASVIGFQPKEDNNVGPVPTSAWTPGIAGSLRSLDPDRPRKDPLMSRLVLKTECPDRNQLEAWLKNETGNTVSLIGEPIDRDRHWEILVFSSDGKPRAIR
jgi:hypothetical protein